MLDTGTTVGTLQGLRVDEDAIREIVAILQRSEDELHGGHPRALNTTYLGGSEKGALLGHHTSIAHRHVVEALEQMVAGLQGYQSNVKKFHHDVDLTDTTAADDDRRINEKVLAGDVPSVQESSACASAPDVRDNPVCTIPTGGEDG